MGYFKQTSICIVGVPEEEEKGAESLFKEIVPRNVANLEN